MTKFRKKKTSPILTIAKGIFGVFLLAVLCLALLIVKLQFTSEKTAFNKELASKVSYTPLEKIVPGDGLPSGVNPMKSNNNLDLAAYKGRYYFAFRTAPTHFASTKTTLYVLSSQDAKKWDFETKFNLNNDLREPRFLVFKDKLFLYFFKGGSNPLSFAPENMYATEFVSAGKWLKPKPFYNKGYVIWRAKEHNGRAYMSVYYGAGLYSNETDPGHLRFLVSDDGYNYEMVNNSEVLTQTSAEEGEFEFDKSGDLYATIRLEIFGGKVCRAPKQDLSAWICRYTPYKYDSSLMFKHGDEFYVVARRNVAGAFNRNSTLLPMPMRAKWYLIRYSGTRKRTTLYHLNKKELTLEPMFDFPSRGDTAYAGIVRTGPNKYLLYNYSSDINGFDWSWIGGQLVGSNIYGTTLTFK
ncbi:MAG TPA: hypothetical protein PLQ76_01285 [bacterium]|nr:hypothetical protein [bacterium]